MTDKELMQEVLEAMESLHRTGDTQVFDMCAAPVLIPALRERLAQPEHCQCPECRITPHASDCAVHNEPAHPKGACNCQAQPEQEPVVWMYQDKSTHEVRFQKHMRDFVDHGATYETPLYTTPPAQRTWVGLTDEEVIKCTPTWGGTVEDVARAVEAKLKEKNT